MVTTGDDQRTPAIWSIIKDAWTISCDEVSARGIVNRNSQLNYPQETLHVVMYGSVQADGVTIKIHKLRFGKPEDFWTFMAHFSFARVQAYSSEWVDETYPVPSHSSITD